MAEVGGGGLSSQIKSTKFSVTGTRQWPFDRKSRDRGFHTSATGTWNKTICDEALQLIYSHTDNSYEKSELDHTPLITSYSTTV